MESSQEHQQTPKRKRFEQHFDDLSIPRFTFFSAACSIAENTLLYPFQLLKTREQVDRACNPHLSPIEITKAQARHAWRSGGIRAFYTGFWTSSLLYAPIYPLYLVTYTYVKKLGGWQPSGDVAAFQQYLVPAIAGICADAVSIPLMVPADVVVQRLQLRDAKFHGGLDAIRTIFNQEGLKGLSVTHIAVLHASLRCVTISDVCTRNYIRSGFFKGTGATIASSAVSSGTCF